VKEATDRATLLAQKIVDARTSLMHLRQRHPHPRLTIALADEKLADQVTEMQKLNDEVQAAKQKNKAEKTRMKTTTTDLENIGIEAAEAAKQAEMAHVEEDDSRIIPLYDWYVVLILEIRFLNHISRYSSFRYSASLALHSSINKLEELQSASENELLLIYKLDSPSHSSPHRIVIALIFAPDTRRLADAHVSGLEELGVEIGDLIDSHVQVDDVHGFVAAVLMRARAGCSV